MNFLTNVLRDSNSDQIPSCDRFYGMRKVPDGLAQRFLVPSGVHLPNGRI